MGLGAGPALDTVRIAIKKDFMHSLKQILVSLVVLVGVAGLVHANVPELDMDLMQTIEDTNKNLASNIATQNPSSSIADARELHALFSTVESHFVAKGDAPDAVKLSQKSKDLTTAIIKSLEGKDFTAATEAATELSRTCRACHTFYKKS